MFPASTNGGGVCFAFPDTCKLPNGVPTPFPNIGQCTQAQGSTCSSKVKILNKKTFTKKTKLSRSMGDEPGVLKGIISNTQMSKVNRKQAYSKVKVEGTPIVTWLKVTTHNGSNANAPPGTQVAPSQGKVKCLG